MRRDHALAKKRRVTWAELAAYDFISVAKSSGNRLLLDQALAGVQGAPQAIYEAQHVTTQLGLVEAGLGVAAVPAMAMPAADHPLLVSVPLVDPVVTRKVGLIRRKGRTLSPAALQLYGFFQRDEGQARRGPGKPGWLSVAQKLWRTPTCPPDELLPLLSADALASTVKAASVLSMADQVAYSAVRFDRL